MENAVLALAGANEIELSVRHQIRGRGMAADEERLGRRFHEQDVAINQRSEKLRSADATVTMLETGPSIDALLPGALR